jgi:hypothetical protein
MSRYGLAPKMWKRNQPLDHLRAGFNSSYLVNVDDDEANMEKRCLLNVPHS